MPFKPISLKNVIAKAGWLLAKGYVQQKEGVVRECWSQRFKDQQIYRVTVDSCTCWMGENRRSVVCKHRWAAFGGIAVVITYEILNATNLEDLNKIAADYKNDVSSVPVLFLEIAREQYRQRRAELIEEGDRPQLYKGANDNVA